MKGHIRERSPGHWAIVLDVRDPATSKRRRKWHAFAGTKRQAQNECARLMRRSMAIPEPANHCGRAHGAVARTCTFTGLAQDVRAVLRGRPRKHPTGPRSCAAHQASTSTDFRNVWQSPFQWPKRRQRRAFACERPLHASALERGIAGPRTRMAAADVEPGSFN